MTDDWEWDDPKWLEGMAKLGNDLANSGSTKGIRFQGAADGVLLAAIQGQRQRPGSHLHQKQHFSHSPK